MTPDVLDPLTAVVQGFRVVALVLIPVGVAAAAASTLVAAALARVGVADQSLGRMLRLIVVGACVWLSGPLLLDSARELTSLGLRGHAVMTVPAAGTGEHR